MQLEQLTEFANRLTEVIQFTTEATTSHTQGLREATPLLRQRQFSKASSVVISHLTGMEEAEVKWRSLIPPEELKSIHESTRQVLHEQVRAHRKVAESYATGNQVTINTLSQTAALLNDKWKMTLQEYTRQLKILSARAKLTALSGRVAGISQSMTDQFKITPQNELPRFSDVGGMEPLKNEFKDSLGLLLKYPNKAREFGINWNGFLLYGPPGSGKTFIAQAVAGEFGLNFLAVGTAELTSKWRGESAKLIDRVFDIAKKNLPCLLFFDEFDSIAASRGDNLSQEDRGVVNQLLRSLEASRDEPRLVVMAATNDIDHLDDAVIRPGRFDRRVRIDYPDHEGRKAILTARLAKLPTSNIDLNLLARRCQGYSAAAIVEVVQQCAIDAFRQQTTGGAGGSVTTESLLAAIDRRGGQDRPKVEEWNWNDLVLDSNTKQELQMIQAFIERPELADSFGIAPPTGLLLYGPPGTGKTTIAKVLAAETKASFYAVSSSDIVSKWVGESERNVAKLFARARENRPSIIFIDEIDALFPQRSLTSASGGLDRLVNTFLQEIDGIAGQQGIFMVGATNRRDILDPALLRGGRLSRHVEIPLPDSVARTQLLRIFTEKMPLSEVNLDDLVDQTQGMSGADMKALCQSAAMLAAVRVNRANGASAAVTPDDFQVALRQARHIVMSGD